MKVHFLYKVTNRATGRCYIARHATANIHFATPAQPLHTFKTSELQPTALPRMLYHDIKQYGVQHFYVEAITSSTDPDTIKRQRKQLLTQLRTNKQPLYNTNNGQMKNLTPWMQSDEYNPRVAHNPMRSKWCQDRVRQAMKKRVKIRDEKGRVLKHLTPEDATPAKVFDIYYNECVRRGIEVNLESIHGYEYNIKLMKQLMLDVWLEEKNRRNIARNALSAQQTLGEPNGVSG